MNQVDVKNLGSLRTIIYVLNQAQQSDNLIETRSWIGEAASRTQEMFENLLQRLETAMARREGGSDTTTKNAPNV